MSTTKDRRQHTRQARDERVVVQIVSSTHDTLPPGTVVRCSTKDISAQGLRIQLDQKVPEGFKVELWVEVSNHPTKFFLSGEVKWCQVLDEAKRYLVGVELNEGETEDFKLWQQVLEAANSAALDRVREA
jgi:Tfp pilus assembly protein PilZ